MNPVIFNRRQSADGLTVYSKHLDDFFWKDRIVGLTHSGFLYVDERVSKGTYYELHPKLLPWDEIWEVTTSRCFSFGGTLLGIASLSIAVFAFGAGWIKRTHTGPGIVMMPIFGGIGGVVFVLGAIRNRIIVRSNTKTLTWMCMPLNYRKTLPLCRKAAEKARAHDVETVQTHA